MARSQISCLCSLPLWLLLPRLPGRNVPLSDKAHTAGPPSTELLSKTTCKGQETGDWKLETGELQIPPQTVYDHLCYSQERLTTFHSLLLSFQPVIASESVKSCKTHWLCGQWWVQTGLISRKWRYESVCVCTVSSVLSRISWAHSWRHRIATDWIIYFWCYINVKIFAATTCSDSPLIRQWSITFSFCWDAPDMSIIAKSQMPNYNPILIKNDIKPDIIIEPRIYFFLNTLP